MGCRMDLLKDRFIDLFTHSQQSFLTDTFSRNPKSRSHVIRTAVQKLDTLFSTKSSQKQQQTLVSYIDCLIGSDLSACRIFLTEIKNKHIDPNLFKPFKLQFILEEDLQRAAYFCDALKFAEGITKDDYFLRMDELKKQNKEFKELVWKACAVPEEWSSFLKQAVPMSVQKLELMRNEIAALQTASLHDNQPSKPVMVWIVEEAVYGWNRRQFQSSYTIRNASMEFTRIVQDFINQNMHYEELHHLKISTLTEPPSPSPPLSSAHNAFKRQKNAHTNTEETLRQIHKICHLFKTTNIFDRYSKCSYISSSLYSNLVQCLQDLNVKTNGYLEIVRNFLKSNSSINYFVTRQSLLFTAGSLICLGLNEFVSVEQLICLEGKSFDSFLYDLRSVFGSHCKMGILSASRAEIFDVYFRREPNRKQDAVNFKVFDVETVYNLQEVYDRVISTSSK